MIWKPHVTVAAVAERDGRFLLVEEEIEGRLVINQPAGHLDPGESLVDAVVRETLEETAWHFRPTALVGVYRWVNPDNDATFVRFTFAGQVADHEPQRPLDKEIRRVLWLGPDELDARADQLRSPLVRRAIDDYRAGRRYPLDLLLDLG
ncbi:MAG TPA: NUDIX hydrolase [Gammaproteobacteria bacterium]|nr:NUDIX hydrolase [Gammaproteobacteria bacterium]